MERLGNSEFGGGLLTRSNLYSAQSWLSNDTACLHASDYTREEQVRFDSFRFQTFRKFIGSVRFGSGNCFSRFDAVRPAFIRTRRGSVRFGSVRLRVRFRSVPELNGSVRFGSAGSVRFLIPSCL